MRERKLRLGSKEVPIPALCGCIAAPSAGGMLDMMEKARQLGADCVELRVDSLKSGESLDRLLGSGLPCILTNRPKREGGWYEGDEEERVGVLEQGIVKGADAVDIEYSTPRPLLSRVLEKAREAGATTILSYHDFERTPSLTELREKVTEMKAIGSDLLKVVTTARSPRDVVTLLDLLISADRPLIAFAMGDLGRVSRILAASFGCPVLYASVNRPTAPGQLDLPTLAEILRKLDIR